MSVFIYIGNVVTRPACLSLSVLTLALTLSPSDNCSPQANTSYYETVHKLRDISLKFGTVKLIKAYLRLSDHSSGKGNNLRSDLQACGVSLTDCPHNGRKDVADKMMLGVLFLSNKNDPLTEIASQWI